MYEKIKKENVLNFLNSGLKEYLHQLNEIAIDGFKYEYKEGSIYEMIVDDRAFKFFKHININRIPLEDLQKVYFHYRANGKLEFNYPKLNQRLQYFIRIFNNLRKANDQNVATPEMYLLFTSYLNAELKLFNETNEEYVFLHSGLYHYQNFCLFFQYWTETYEIAKSKKTPKEYQEFLKGQHVTDTKYLIQRIALQCLGLYSDTKENFYRSKAFEISVWELCDKYLREIAELDKRMINWDTLEIFMLCHEFGHYYLGHLEELKEWNNSKTQKLEEHNYRKKRRKEMEFEADAFAFQYTIPILNISRIDHNKKEVDFSNFREFGNLILNPLLYFFVIASYFDDMPHTNNEYYPKAKDRFNNLMKDYINENLDAVWDGLYKEIFNVEIEENNHIWK